MRHLLLLSSKMVAWQQYILRPTLHVNLEEIIISEFWDQLLTNFPNNFDNSITIQRNLTFSELNEYIPNKRAKPFLYISTLLIAIMPPSLFPPQLQELNSSGEKNFQLHLHMQRIWKNCSINKASVWIKFMFAKSMKHFYDL